MKEIIRAFNEIGISTVNSSTSIGIALKQLASKWNELDQSQKSDITNKFFN